MVALRARPPREYLVGDDVVDCSTPVVAGFAARLWGEADCDQVVFARVAFEYVRDVIAHAGDAGDTRLTLTASETLRERVGLCHAKAHLLAALLRARGVPAGLCYQRLTDDGFHHAVHGLVAVHLQGGWHRQDPRGNKPGVGAEFSLGPERLARLVRPQLGERDYPELHVHPHPAVLAAMRGASDALELCHGGLPADLTDASDGPDKPAVASVHAARHGDRGA